MIQMKKFAGVAVMRSHPARIDDQAFARLNVLTLKTYTLRGQK